MATPNQVTPMPSAPQNAAAPPPPAADLAVADLRSNPFKTAVMAHMQAQTQAIDAKVPEDQRAEKAAQAAQEAVKPASQKPPAQQPPAQAAPKADDTPAASPTDPALDLTTNDAPAHLSEKGKVDWLALKTIAKTAREAESAKDARIRQLETELEQQRATANPAELDSLRKAHQDLQNEFKTVAYERTPEYRTRYVEPLNRIVDQAKKMVGQDRSAEIEMLLQMPPSDARTSRIEQLVEGLTPFRQNELASLTVRAGDLITERETARAQASQQFESYQSQVRQQQEQQSQVLRQQTEHVLASRIKWAEEQIPVFFKKVDGNPEQNQAVEANINEMKQLLLGSNDMDSLAQSAAYAVLGKRASTILEAAATEIERQRSQIDKLTSAQPGAGSAAPQSAGPGQTASGEPKSFSQMVIAQLRGE